MTRAIVRCHLGLIVPGDRESCFMDVAGHRIVWEEGKVVFFDDSHPHEVHNNTSERRVVLLIDVPRPMRLEGC